MAAVKNESISLKEKFEITVFQSFNVHEMKQAHISEQLSLPKSTGNTIWINRETLKHL